MAALPVTGLVFAGGLSSRMGVDKALLRYEGTPMLLHVGHKLAAVAAEVLVLTGPRTYPQVPWQQVPDSVPHEGPLAGLMAGLQAASQPWSMAVAVDMPHVPVELPATLLRYSTDFDAVVPLVNGRPEPLCALYGQKCLPAVEALWSQGGRRMMAVFARIRVRYVGPDEIGHLGPLHQIFSNYNTPADWDEISGERP